MQNIYFVTSIRVSASKRVDSPKKSGFVRGGVERESGTLILSRCFKLNRGVLVKHKTRNPILFAALGMLISLSASSNESGKMDVRRIQEPIILDGLIDPV